MTTTQGYIPVWVLMARLSSGSGSPAGVFASEEAARKAQVEEHHDPEEKITWIEEFALRS